MRRALVATVLLLIGCSGSSPEAPSSPPSTAPPVGPPSASTPAPPPAAAPLPPGVTAFSIPGSANELAPLDEIASRVQAIGIGESVHTSGAFVDAKAALARHLVEAQGYRAIAFESPRASVAKAMAPYLASQCTDDGTNAMRALFGVWWTASTRDLMAWLCKYNQAHGSDPVKVVGFDMQQPEDDSAALQDFLPRVAGADAPALVAGITKCNASSQTASSSAYPKADYDTCLTGLDAVDAYFAANAAAITSASSADAFADAKLAALGFRAWQTEIETLDTDPKASFEARDVGMAAVFRDERARAIAGKKTVVWAHNYHLTKNHVEVADSSFVPRAKTMGTLVAQEMGAAYAAVGLVGFDVQVHLGTTTGHVADPSPDAYEVLLHALARPSLFVRLDRTTGDLAGSILRPVGTPTEDTIVPSHQFDAFVFFDVSPPMIPLD